MNGERKSYSPRELAKLLGVTPKCLSRWADDGKIEGFRTDGGHRRYYYDEPKERFQNEPKGFLYARVSSQKQKDDLERQIASLKELYPTFEVISDIGSGINFKRRGLLSLLDKVITGDVSKVVVAHKDRLSRFGFELFEFLFKRFGVELEVISGKDVTEPADTLVDDVLSIITVFTAKYYGTRKYNLLPKDQDLPKQTTRKPLQKMSRGFKVRLQQNRSKSKVQRVSERTIEA